MASSRNRCFVVFCPRLQAGFALPFYIADEMTFIAVTAFTLWIDAFLSLRNSQNLQSVCSFESAPGNALRRGTLCNGIRASAAGISAPFRQIACQSHFVDELGRITCITSQKTVSKLPKLLPPSLDPGKQFFLQTVGNVTAETRTPRNS